MKKYNHAVAVEIKSKANDFLLNRISKFICCDKGLVIVCLKILNPHNCHIRFKVDLAV